MTDTTSSENQQTTSSEVQATIPNEVQDTKQQSLKIKTIIIVAICLVIGVLLGGGIVWFSMNTSDNTDSEPTETTETNTDTKEDEVKVTPTTKVVDDTTESPSQSPAEPSESEKEFLAETFLLSSNGGTSIFSGKMPNDASLEKTISDQEKKFRIVNNNFVFTVNEYIESETLSYLQYEKISNAYFGDLLRVVFKDDESDLYTYVSKNDDFNPNDQCLYLGINIDGPCGNTAIFDENILLVIECKASTSIGLSQCDDIVKSLSIEVVD